MPPPRLGRLAPDRLRQVHDYVRAHLSQEISLDSLAAVACLSSYHFCRVFKHTTGLSPNQYVTEQRLQLARQLLRQSYPVAQVSRLVGYDSPRHFAQLFRRYVGCAPARYRSLHT